MSPDQSLHVDLLGKMDILYFYLLADNEGYAARDVMFVRDRRRSMA